MKKFLTVGMMVASALLLSGCPDHNQNPQAPAPETEPAAAAPFDSSK